MWALGCVMYEVMSLRHAFDADDMNGLVMKIVRGKPVPMPTRYSHGLRDLVSKLLHKNPRQRPTASEVLRHGALRGRVDEWRNVCTRMNSQLHDVLTVDDIDDNMKCIMERHRQRLNGGGGSSSGDGMECDSLCI